MTTTKHTRKFEARYAGRCPACREAIEIGEDLVMDDDIGSAVHLECAGVKKQIAPGEVCPRCFMEKSTSGACDCEDDL